MHVFLFGGLKSSKLTCYSLLFDLNIYPYTVMGLKFMFSLLYFILNNPFRHIGRYLIEARIPYFYWNFCLFSSYRRHYKYWLYYYTYFLKPPKLFHVLVTPCIFHPNMRRKPVPYEFTVAFTISPIQNGRDGDVRLGLNDEL